MPHRHFVILLLALLIPFASATEVSRIDTSGPRPIFIVDGKPFFYHGVQISPHRLESESGWTWAQFAPLFAQAAADGFTVMPVPITWNSHEGARNSWNWSRLETAIDHAARYDLPIEVLWFGASVSATWNCVPSYASSHQLLVNSSGQAVTDAAGHTKFDLSDPGLLADEQAALTTVMAHVASYIAAKGYPGHTVVGVQVMNEPTVTVFEDGSAPTDRSYSSSANAKWSSGGWSNATRFNADVLHHYLLTLAKVVKDSSHQVWTRVNLCDAWEPAVHFQLVTYNETLRNSPGGTPLDFIGVDPYSSSTNQIYDVCTNTAQYRQGKNLMMVMENSGLYANTDRLMFNALAASANYCIWELNQSMPNWDCGLYSTDFTAKTISPRSHTQSVRNFNTMIAKDRRDLATLVVGGGNLSFYNRGFSASSNSSANVGNRSITYSTSSTGGGIALARSDGSLVFFTTAAATFTVPLAQGLARLELGSFAADDSWVSQSQQVWAISGGNVTFTLPAYACARGLPAGLSKVGDVNADGGVDAADRDLVVGGFGRRSADSGWDARRDLNQDARVDADDLSIVLRNQGR